MAADGVLQVRGGTEGKYTWTNVTDNLFKASNTQDVLTLKKTGSDDKGLDGSTFIITPEDGRTFADGTSNPITISPTKDAGVTLTGLLVTGNPGTKYTIHEVTAPDGYAYVPDFWVWLDEDGGVQIEKGDSSVSASGSTVTVKDEPTKFGLVKLDTDTTKPNLLGGSVFTLTGKFAGGTTVETKTLNPTAVDGAELRAQLVASTNDTDETHTYTLTETVPPEGYKITAAPVTIRISREGTIQYKNNGTWTDDNSSPFLFIRDELNSFGLNKTDTNGTTRLTGATYTVTGKFAGDTASTSKTLTSDASSTPQLKGVLVAGNTYTIAETVPAPGYIISPLSDSYKDAVLDGGAMTIRMDASGVLSYLSGDDKWTTVNENTLLFKDALTSIDLEKTGTENSKKMLNGSEYTLTGIFADGTTSKVLKSTDKTAATLNGQLIVTTDENDTTHIYKLYESTLPDGYIRSPITESYKNAKLDSDGKLSIRLNASGNIQYLTSSGTWTDIEGNLLHMEDAMTSLTVKKLGSNSQLLSGATLSILNANGQTVKKWTTSSTASVTLTGLLSVGQIYRLHEDKAPTGYTAVSDIYLQVSAEGQFSRSADGKTNWTAVDNNVLSVIDNKIVSGSSSGTSGASGTSTVTGTTVSAAKTGDYAPLKIAVYLVLCAISALAFFFAIYKRRDSRK